MEPLSKLPLVLRGLWLILVASSAGSAFSADLPTPTIEWIGGAGVEWNDARNWSPGRIPGAADHVRIAAGGVTVNAAGTVRIASLRVGSTEGSLARLVTRGDFGVSTGVEVLPTGGVQLASGAWSASVPWQIRGDFQWTGGRLYGQIILESLSTGLVEGENLRLASDDASNPTVITNRGTLIFRGSSSYIYAFNGSRVVNEGRCRLESVGQVFYYCCGGPLASFENRGVLETFQQGGALLLGNIRFRNSGEIQIQQGEFRISVEAVFEAGGRLTGPGPLRLVGQTSTFEGEQRLDGPIEFAGAEIRGKVVLRGPVPAVWSAGRIYDEFTVLPGATLRLQGGDHRFASDANSTPCTFTNQGTVEWSTPGSYIYAFNNSLIVNQGLWRLGVNDTLFYYCCGGNLATFVNVGTLHKAQGAGLTSLGNVVLDQRGTLRVEEGPLRISTTATFRAGARIVGDSVLSLSGGDSTFEGILQVQGPLSFDGANIRGALRLSGPVPVKWTAGRIFGEVVVEPSATFEVTGGVHLGSDDNANPAALINRGLVLWRTPGSYIYAYNHTTMLNEGTWRAEVDGQMVYYCCGGERAVFTNVGTFSKSGGTGVTSLGNVFLDQRGLLTASGGPLHINADATFRDGSRIGGSQRTRLVGGTDVFEGRVLIQGGGLDLAGGAIRGSGVFSGTSPLIWTSSRVLGALTIDSGATLRVEGGGAHFGSTDDSNPASITNRGTVRWASSSAYLYSYNSTRILNQGLWTFDVPIGTLFYYCCGGGRATFINEGQLRKGEFPGSCWFGGNQSAGAGRSDDRSGRV